MSPLLATAKLPDYILLKAYIVAIEQGGIAETAISGINETIDSIITLFMSEARATLLVSFQLSLELFCYISSKTFYHTDIAMFFVPVL